MFFEHLFPSSPWLLFAVPFSPSPSFGHMPHPHEVIYSTWICAAHFRMLPPSFAIANGGISGPCASVLTCTCVCFKVLVAPQTSARRLPNPPAVRKAGYINNSYALLYTSAWGSGKLISFARKGLWDVWNPVDWDLLHSRCNSAFSPQPGLTQPDITPVGGIRWYLHTVGTRGSAGWEWWHALHTSELWHG